MVATLATELASWTEWWPPDGYSLLQAQHFLELTARKKDWFSRGALVVDGRVSGSFRLETPTRKAPNTLEIGHWLANDVTSRRLGTRAAALLTETGFETGASMSRLDIDWAIVLLFRVGFG